MKTREEYDAHVHKAMKPTLRLDLLTNRYPGPSREALEELIALLVAGISFVGEQFTPPATREMAHARLIQRADLVPPATRHHHALLLTKVLDALIVEWVEAPASKAAPPSGDLLRIRQGAEGPVVELIAEADQPPGRA